LGENHLVLLWVAIAVGCQVHLWRIIPRAHAMLASHDHHVLAGCCDSRREEMYINSIRPQCDDRSVAGVYRQLTYSSGLWDISGLCLIRVALGNFLIPPCVALVLRKHLLILNVVGARSMKLETITKPESAAAACGGAAAKQGKTDIRTSKTRAWKKGRGSLDRAGAGGGRQANNRKSFGGRQS
jgi:hypothetical protein